MLKKQRVKARVIAAAVLLLAAETLYADSASNSGTLVVPANAKANQMYLLDTGTVDFKSASAAGIDSGGLAKIGPVSLCPGTSPCVGTTNSKGICPSGFIPYIVTTPYKSASLQSSGTSGNAGVAAVCPYLFWVSNSSEGYAFSVVMTTLSSAQTVAGNAVAFNWSIFCYPGSYTSPLQPGPNQWTYADNGGTCSDTSPQYCRTYSSPVCNQTGLAPTVTYDKQPLMWDTGFMEGNAGGNAWVTTQRQCPASYSPYVTTSLYSASNSSQGTSTTSANLPGQNFMCVSTPPSVSGSGYTFQTYSSTIPGWIRNQGAQWTLYCYPPGITPPAYPTCALPTPQGPFILDSGITYRNQNLTFDPNNAATQYMMWFQILKQCPTGWNTVPVFAPAYSAPGNINIYTISGGACKVTYGTTPETIIKYFAFSYNSTTGAWAAFSDVSYTIYCYPPGTQGSWLRDTPAGGRLWYDVGNNVANVAPFGGCAY